MNKFFLLILCLGCWTQSFSQTELNLTPEEEEQAWDFLIKTFFPKGMSESSHRGMFYSDISYYLINPTKIDSIGLQNFIDQINPLVPQEVFFSKTKEEANFILEINTLKDASNFRIDYKNTETKNRNGYLNKELTAHHFSLAAPSDYRLAMIRNWALIGLVSSEIDLLVKTEIPQDHFISESIIYNLYSKHYNLYDPYYKIKDVDKFVLSKLYAKDLDKQLQNFIIGKYGTWVWLNFLFSTEVVQTSKLIVFIFLIILITSLLYGPITQFRLKYKILNYVFLSIILSNIIVASFMLYGYFKVWSDNKPLSGDLIEPMKWKLFLTLMSSISMFAVLFSLLLFALDYLILTHYKKPYSRFFSRTAIFTLSVVASGIFILVLTQNFSPVSTSMVTFGSICLILFGFARSIFYYFNEKNEHLILAKDLQLSYLAASKAEAEVASLHARINPHFLYNSLNSIAGLAHVDADKTEKMAISLSDLFRHNLNRKNESSCSLQEEIEAVEAYLKIEQIRFDDRLDYQLEVDKTLVHYHIPRNIIQPLIENAIKHGLSNQKESGQIKLQIVRNQEQMEISVYDNGPVFPEDIVSGYGLQSIFDILHLTYEDKAGIAWENLPEKRIVLSISITELKKQYGL